MEDRLESIYKQEISKPDFDRLVSFIYNVAGIVLPESKKNLVEGRIRRRIKETGFDSYDNYIKYLFTGPGRQNEIVPLIDIITTNKTDFFRENNHFEYLISSALPRITNNSNENNKKSFFQFWSAGCSTGEEPYTLAIVLNEFFSGIKESSYRIFATDISTSVLKTAAMGIFEYERIEIIPDDLKKKYLLKSKDKSKKLVRMGPELRSKIDFSRLNLMDDAYDLPGYMDAVFCRNVLIYFNKATQEAVINKFARKMKKGAYLFLGHSETIMGMSTPFERAASTVYVKV